MDPVFSTTHFRPPIPDPAHPRPLPPAAAIAQEQAKQLEIQAAMKGATASQQGLLWPAPAENQRGGDYNGSQCFLGPANTTVSSRGMNSDHERVKAVERDGGANGDRNFIKLFDPSTFTDDGKRECRTCTHAHTHTHTYTISVSYCVLFLRVGSSMYVFKSVCVISEHIFLRTCLCVFADPGQSLSSNAMQRCLLPPPKGTDVVGRHPDSFGLVEDYGSMPGHAQVPYYSGKYGQLSQFSGISKVINQNVVGHEC
jgi:hypothetical protein